MKRIYEAANNVEAHMIVHLLNGADIEAHVQGEHLQSGVGELPMGGLVAVAVADDDAESARRLIQEWEARTRTKPEPTSSRTAKGAFPGQLIAFVVGGLIAGSIVWSIHHGPDSHEGLDLNDDGKIDVTYYFDGDRSDRSESDRNFDGKVDSIERYDLKGWLRRIETDDDFDGRLESVTTYQDGQPLEWRIDRDGNGKPDYRLKFRFGVAELEEHFNSSGVAVRRVTYTGGKPDKAELDLDADGTWERSYRFDRYDEPTDIETTN